MRSLIIAIIIIVLTFGMAAVNALWTSGTINAILNDVDALTLDSKELPHILEDWANAKMIFTLTVHRVYLREIDDAFQKVEAAIDLKDDFEFDTAKSALIYKMEELRSSQTFELKTIL